MEFLPTILKFSVITREEKTKGLEIQLKITAYRLEVLAAYYN